MTLHKEKLTKIQALNTRKESSVSGNREVQGEAGRSWSVLGSGRSRVSFRGACLTVLLVL